MHVHENCCLYLSKEILLTGKHQGENNSYNYEEEEAAVVVTLWVRSLSYVKAKNVRNEKKTPENYVLLYKISVSSACMHSPPGNFPAQASAIAKSLAKPTCAAAAAVSKGKEGLTRAELVNKCDRPCLVSMNAICCPLIIVCKLPSPQKSVCG
jgi:hypothetical protein